MAVAKTRHIGGLGKSPLTTVPDAVVTRQYRLITTERREMNRPTLESQIRLSKMSEDELKDLFLPHGFWQKLDHQIFLHFESLWEIIHWNWFDIWEGSEDANKYRSWGIKIKRKLFGGNNAQKHNRVGAKPR